MQSLQNKTQASCVWLYHHFPTPVLEAGLRIVEISLPNSSLYKGHKTPSKAKIHCSVPFSSSSSICEAHSSCHHPLLLWSDFQIDTVLRPKITLEACWCVCWSWSTGKGTARFVEFFCLTHYVFVRFHFVNFGIFLSIRGKKEQSSKAHFHACGILH